MATKRRSSKQSGGTVLGIVLGLIVGLAIAVVVALYITHTPTPFVSKGAPPPASDAGTNAAPFDPNRPLQGKSPSQAVPQSAQPTPPNTAPGQINQSQSSGLLDEPQIVEVPPSANVPAAKPPASSPQANASTPPSAQQTSKPPASTPSAAAASRADNGNSGYLLQVGAYKTRQDAEQQRARLALQGFESKVTERGGGGITYYRVRIGPFGQFADMNNVRQRLSDAGVDTVVIRFTKQ
jgi:cell division protein FtsN